MTAPALTARPARFFVGMGSTALALALGATPLVLSASASAAPKPTVTICHGTGSNSSPYVEEHPAPDSKLIQGHGSHVGPIWFSGITVAWGDIIPSFTYKDNGVTKTYPGLNWTTLGQQWVANGCLAPSTGGGGGTTTGSTTPPTTGGTTPPTTGGTNPTTGGTNPTTGGNNGPSTGGNTAPPSAGGTGGFSGGGTGAVLTDPIAVTAPVTHRPVTGGGGKVTVTKTATKPVTKPVTKPAAKPATRTTRPAAKALPFTGDHTSTFALWGLASVVGGIGFTMLGQRKGRHAL